MLVTTSDCTPTFLCLQAGMEDPSHSRWASFERMTQVAITGHKLFQNLLLLGPQRSVIRWRNLLEQDPSRLRPQSVSHVFLLSVKQPEIACDRSPSASHDPLPFVRSIARERVVEPEVISTLVSS